MLDTPFIRKKMPRLIQWQYQLRYFFSGKKNGTSQRKLKKDRVIISLTSYPARVNKLYLCIESLMHQTHKPDKIILYLAKEQFNNQLLPKRLLKLQERGLTICYCDEDLRSYKKYYYVMQEYPDDIIITVDDDWYYPSYMVENLLASYINHPDCVSAMRCHKITKKDGRLQRYNDWQHTVDDQDRPSHSLFVTTGGGTLYPPHCLDQEAFKKEIFGKLSPYADDVWINAMLLRQKINIVKAPGPGDGGIYPISLCMEETLMEKNVNHDGNDTAIHDVYGFYGLLKTLNDVAEDQAEN